MFHSFMFWQLEAWDVFRKKQNVSIDGKTLMELGLTACEANDTQGFLDKGTTRSSHCPTCWVFKAT